MNEDGNIRVIEFMHALKILIEAKNRLTESDWNMIRKIRDSWMGEGNGKKEQ